MYYSPYSLVDIASNISLFCAICCYRCLGPNGFTVCNEDALWILTKRSGKTTYSLVSLLNESPAGLCLQQKYGRLSIFSTDSVIMGSCTTKSAKSWDFDFLDQGDVIKVDTRTGEYQGRVKE